MTRNTICQTFFYSVCRTSKIKANDFTALSVGGQYYFVESKANMNIHKEVQAHCGWCAKVEVITKDPRFQTEEVEIEGKEKNDY